jgi:hypothetical protein
LPSVIVTPSGGAVPLLVSVIVASVSSTSQ